MLERKLIKIFENMSLLTELKGDNPFKARAYTNAARIIKEQKINIAEAVKNNSLKDIKGFGDALQKKITEYVETGKIEKYEKLLEEVPKGLLDISKISGIGFVKARSLYYEHGIHSIEELEKTCLENQLIKIKGFSEKSQEIIVTSIAYKKAFKGKVLQQQALETAKEMLAFLKQIPFVINAEISGDVRRFSEIVGNIFIVAATNEPEKLFASLTETYPVVKDGDLIVYHPYAENSNLFIEAVKPENFGWRLHQTTGNDEYLAEMQKLFAQNNLKAENYFLIENGTSLKIENEAQIFQKLNIPFIPPEIRESSRAVIEATQNTLPTLLEPTDLKGMLHVHSIWSDGISTIQEMALKSKELGFSYMAICDHSRTAVYANGMSIERITAQHEEIDKLNEEELGIRILKGIESDILPDGSLDYPEEILQKFDIVVASVHSSFKMTKAQMTQRIIYALMSPYTNILGHPTGRLLLSRSPYEVDIKEVIDAAADLGKIIEINASPYRLDLSWKNAIYAKEKGVKLAINPDSHTTDTLSDVFLGVNIARKAWLTKDNVINCLEYNELLKILH